METHSLARQSVPERMMTDYDGQRPAIKLIELTKRYGDQVAVDHLDLAIPCGSIFGLIGPNGAGKSTTIKMIMGMLPATSGSVYVLGIDASAQPSRVKQLVGYVPEMHYIYRWMRVGEVISFTKPLYHRWDDRVCADLLSLFGLDLRKRVKHLSKGMLTKLALLLAVAHTPEVLILDEPMSGMDPLAREEFLEVVVQSLRRRLCTVLFSSHSLDDVQRLADTVGLLHEGRLLAHSGVTELLRSTKRIEAVLEEGRAPEREPVGTIWQSVQRQAWSLTIGDFRPEVVEEIRAGNPVITVTVRDLDLEEVFKDFLKGRRSPR
jgi:ABC-2 type transport system ATP-binding protein